MFTIKRIHEMSTDLQTRFRVGGMDCASCASKIDTAVRRMPGVEDVSVSVTAGTMSIRHDQTSDLDAIGKKVRGLGYSVERLAGRQVDNQTSANHGAACCGGDAHHHANGDSHTHSSRANSHDAHDHDSHEHGKQDRGDRAAAIEGLHGHDHGPSDGPWWKSKKGRATLLAGAALVVAYVIGHLMPSIQLYAFAIAMLVGLVPIARRAIMAALAGTPLSIEMLMTIAAVGALAINATEEAAAVVFLFLVGELLEGVAAGKARDSIKSLAASCRRPHCWKRRAKPARCRPKAFRSAPSFLFVRVIAYRQTASSCPAKARSTKRR